MKNTICLTLILLSGWASASNIVEPKIIPVNDNVGTVELGYTVTEALRSFDNDFKLLEVSQFIPSVQDMFKDAENETPMAVVADFNNDRKKDVVVMGHAHKELLVLAVLSNDNGYSVKTVSRQVLSDPKSTYYPPGSEGEVILQKGLFQYLSIGPGDEQTSKLMKAEYKSEIAFLIETAFSSTTSVYFVKSEPETVCEITGTKIVNKKKTLKTTCSDKKR